MKEDDSPVQRVIGFDSHPDSFTAAIVRGETPATAIVETTFDKVPLARLPSWAQKHTTAQDLFVLEASGNSFHVVRTLAKIGRKALVLESCQMGKLKEAHANNDKISAVRIGKAYLAGTAKEVWVPDLKTQQRRDLFHAHQKSVKRSTQARNSLLSYLSDNGVRLKRNTALVNDPKGSAELLRQSHEWSASQWRVVEGWLLELRQAEEGRRHWRAVIAHEVAADAELLRLMRLCGVREIVAFALGAIIGDINRFARPGSLVKYVGLNPAFDDSGQEQWRGGIGGHGRKDLRSLLVQAAQSILRSGHELAQWGKRLLARKGRYNLAVAAVARKLIVAVWYLMMGRWTTLEEIDRRLTGKLGSLITRLGTTGLQQMGKSRQQFREQLVERLKDKTIYVLKPGWQFNPQTKEAVG